MHFRNHKEEILHISSENNIVIRKNQGQCFLINNQIADYIIDQANLNSNQDLVLEIGPGFGALTQSLVRCSKHVTAIEIDKKISEYLLQKFSHNENFTLINRDVLKCPFPIHNVLISNVPYHISGPLLQKIVLSENKATKIFLMLQEEFINRMKAQPQAKGYGRISVISQLFFDIDTLRNVSRYEFYPQPEVESGVISLKFKPGFVNHPDIPYFLEFLAGLFPYKNKIFSKSIAFLKKNLGNYPKLSSLENLDLERDVPAKMKNKRVWQLMPIEIWEVFEILKNA